MTRIEFNQAKQQSRNPLLGSAINNNLTTNRARQLYLEASNKIDMKYNYKITIVHPPIDNKNSVIKEHSDNNFFPFQIKKTFLSKNITEIIKEEFDKVTTKSLQLNKIQVNEELINEFIKSADEITNKKKF